MKITKVKSWVESLGLKTPYTIAYQTIDSVENAFVLLETDDGTLGLGAGAPAEFITGESMQSCREALETHLEELLLGQDLRHFYALLRKLEDALALNPAARAAADMALHDLAAKQLGLPLVELLGRVHESLPTSVTIGIMSPEEAVERAREYVRQGFGILKLKTGQSVEQDLETVRKVREAVGSEIKIRVDANQGYSVETLRRLAEQADALQVEFVEQPLPAGEETEMLLVPEGVRRRCAADESLHTPADALQLVARPHAFGIFNIKLMKCGGIHPALQIAAIAHLAGIELMWGCMDESRVSIAAALHAALACPATRYLDLDGSFDLARDLAAGGFGLENGRLRPADRPGLGVELV